MYNPSSESPVDTSCIDKKLEIRHIWVVEDECPPKWLKVRHEATLVPRASAVQFERGDRSWIGLVRT